MAGEVVVGERMRAVGRRAVRKLPSRVLVGDGAAPPHRQALTLVAEALLAFFPPSALSLVSSFCPAGRGEAVAMPRRGTMAPLAKRCCRARLWRPAVVPV